MEIAKKKKKKKPLNNQSNLKKKNKPGGINLLDFRLYYKAIIINTVWYCHKDRNIDQRNKIESPEIKPHTYGQPLFDKGGKYIQWEKKKKKKTISLTTGAGKTGQPHVK